ALHPSILNGLSTLATALRTTLSILVHSAWALALMELSGNRRVTFGITGSGRSRHQPPLSAVIGPCIETVPLAPPAWDGERRLKDWLNVFAEGQTKALAHGGYSLTQLGEQADEPMPPGWLSTLVVAHGFTAQLGLETDASVFETLSVTEHSDLPLAVLWVQDDRGLHGSLLLRQDRVEQTTAERLRTWFEQALTQLAAATPYTRLGALDLLSPREHEHLDALEEASVDVDASLIADRVHGHCLRSPAHLALVDCLGRLNFAELNLLVDAIATQLDETLGSAGILAMQLPSGRYSVAVMQACWRTGRTIVPIHQQASARSALELAEACQAAAIVRLSTEPNESLGAPLTFEVLTPGAAPYGERPERYAYFLFTSGSTGTPKAVRVTQSNLAYSTAVRDQVFAPPERFLLLSAPAFDSAMVGFCWPLATGNTLVVASDAERRDPAAIAALIARERVTHLLCIPSLYETVLEFATEQQLASLRAAIVAGEACPRALPAAHAAKAPRASLYNEYGPTEATVWCSVATLYDATSGSTSTQPSIGRPLPGTRLSVEDQRGRRRAPGLVGELVVRGPGVADGYLGHEDSMAFSMTADGLRYRTGDRARWDDSGELLFLGRLDRQVKLAGQRIELEAIEHRMREVAGVRDAHVVVLSRANATYLGACYCLDTAANADVEPALQEHLESTLLPMARPRQLLRVDYLPTNRNGKVDSTALTQQLLRASPSREPSAPLEHPLQQLYAEVLGLDAVAMDDDFFALGGDSILVLKLVAAARHRELELKPSQVFDYPTPALLEDQLRRSREATEGAFTSDTDLQRWLPVTPIEAWFFDLPLRYPNHWTLPVALLLEQPVAASTLEALLQALVTRHSALRTPYRATESGWVAGPPVPARVELMHSDADAVDRLEFEPDWFATLDIEAGHLFSPRLIDRGTAAPILLLVAHHLAVDAISWQRLLGDLHWLLNASEAQRKRYGAATVDRGNQRWRHVLAAADRKPAILAQRTYWRTVTRSPGLAPRTPLRPTPVIERSSVTLVDCSLTPAIGTDELERLVLAALALVMAEDGEQLIWLERHGRRYPVASVEPGDAVGWFTTQFPFRLPTAGSTHDTLQRVNERWNEIPDAGLSYGILCRAAEGDSDVDLSPAHPIDLTLNVIGGAFEQDPDTASTQGLRLYDPTALLAQARHPQDCAPTALEVNVLWRNSCLRVELTRAHPSIDQRFLDQLVHAIRQVSEARGNTENATVDLSAAELDQLLDGL
ncbi:MAG: AMP-binding protein, partial [Pseudomonadota bacterium]